MRKTILLELSMLFAILVLLAANALQQMNNDQLELKITKQQAELDKLELIIIEEKEYQFYEGTYASCIIFGTGVLEVPYVDACKKVKQRFIEDNLYNKYHMKGLQDG